MNAEYKEKLDLLQSIVQKGIAKLLTEAKNKDYLEPPYGRLPFPTPLISEDEFIAAGALESDDVESQFKFEYGFDPLKMLADYIVWSHPNTVEERRQKKIAAAKFLQNRAEHARRQVYTSHNLKLTSHKELSGILWGPITSPLSCTSVLVSCKSIKKGKIIIQLSKFRDFHEIIEKQEIKVDYVGETEDPQLEDLLPIKATFNNLIPATKYFLRSCLSSNPIPKIIIPRKVHDTSAKLAPEEDTEEECVGLLFKGLHGESFSQSEFWTLPSEERGAQATIEAEETAVISDHRHGHHHHHKPAENAPVEVESNIFPPVLLHCFGQLPVETFSAVLPPPPVLPLSPSLAPPSRVDPHCPSVTCVLGDLLSPTAAAVTTTTRNENSDRTRQHKRYELLRNLSSVLARCPVFESSGAPLHSSSFLLGWRDGSEGSHYALRAEELAYKQFRHDVRRHKKKYGKSKSNTTAGSTALHMPPMPTIARLPFTDALNSLIEGLPIDPQLLADIIPEPPAVDPKSKSKPSSASMAAAASAAAQAALDMVKATRMMYRTVMLGPDVVVIVLDMRGQGPSGDYLGKEQAGWLDLVLQESVSIQWKIILCGKSFGLINVLEQHIAPAAATATTTTASTSGTTENVVLNTGSSEEDIAVLAQDMSGVSVVPAGSAGEGDTSSAATTTTSAETAALTTTPLDAISENHENVVTAPASSKQVQLPHDGDKQHAAITAAMSDDAEDMYGRSFCSLQHILSIHQTRSNQGTEYNTHSTAVTDKRVIFLSSGIVLLSSGLASVCPGVVASSSDRHHHYPQKDVSSPAFLAGYSNLSAPTVENSMTALETHLLPNSDSTVETVPSELFCAELALGAASMVSSPGSQYFIRDGFEATTVYSAYRPVAEDATMEEDGGGSTTSSPLHTTTSCSLHLTSTGQLHLQLYRADASLRDGTCRDTTPLFECLLEAPIPEDEEEEQEDEAED